jgi:hypothetical protein
LTKADKLSKELVAGLEENKQLLIKLVQEMGAGQSRENQAAVARIDKLVDEMDEVTDRLDASEAAEKERAQRSEERTQAILAYLAKHGSPELKENLLGKLEE